MTRSPEHAPKLARAETVRGDFSEPATLKVAFAGVSAALVVSGSGQPGERAELHRSAFEAATLAGVRHVVYLSLEGAAPDSRYPFSRDHYLSERYLAAAGVSYTVLRNAFYMDMFLERFDAAGVVRGPAQLGRGAFVSREDAARTAAAAVVKQPGGIYDVTGPEALSVAEVAERLSKLMGWELRYQNEPANQTRERLEQSEPLPWRIDLSIGWFEAIADGELERTSDTVFRFTGTAPLTLEGYFRAFPELLRAF